jgi:glycosyltransferase involved in cell wall biosynthesis
VSNFCATSLTANAQGVVNDIASHENVDRVRIKLIKNGVDIPEGTANCRATIPTGVVVANLIHYKGHIDLLRSLSSLHGKFRIIFIGEGPMREEIETEIRVLGLSEIVTLLGFCEDPTSLLLKAQFSILPSHTEGMPNAILESMACGLPVISTDVGGVTELISGKGGLVIGVHDRVSMAKGIQFLIENENFRVSAGVLNRHLAANFSWKEISDEYSRYYQSEMRRTLKLKQSVI